MSIKNYLLSLLLLLTVSCGVSGSLNHKPQTEAFDNTVPAVEKISDTFFRSGSNFLQKNRHGLWEMYVEGDPLQRGLITGALTDSLLNRQENIFFSKVGELVPSNSKQKLLRSFLKWYNRKLYLHVPEEYKTEIFGVSRYSKSDFDHIAPAYLRSLYLHGAHDIGHALQDLALVGCTSFAAWNDNSADGKLIIGRNFDFYAGDDFAKDKIVAFINPDKGHPFMMVTWAGMIGAVSGMNNLGLTVTINASKSQIPLMAKTPISILAREILQYASTTEQAIAIASKRQVFVSESIMIGSAADKKAILIEVAPGKMSVYDVVNSDRLVCSNHFQSQAFEDDKRNSDQIENSHSKYRFERMSELLNESGKVDYLTAAGILRETKGLNDLEIGYGNEKALNQLLAHHGIIFKPEDKQVWVSSNPYQLGAFVCYDLDNVFSPGRQTANLSVAALEIPRDPFLDTEDYKKYEMFRTEDRKADQYLEKGELFPCDWAAGYRALNPGYWVVYYKSGLSLYQNGFYKAAREQFEIALTKEVTTLPERRKIEKYLRKTLRK